MLFKKTIAIFTAVIMTAFSVFGISGGDVKCLCSGNSVSCCCGSDIQPVPAKSCCAETDSPEYNFSKKCNCKECSCSITQSPEPANADNKAIINDGTALALYHAFVTVEYRVPRYCRTIVLPNTLSPLPDGYILSRPLRGPPC